MLEIGAAKTEITTFEPRLGMMGWGMLDNVVETVATPLHARAFVLRDPDDGSRQAIVVCELALISLALKEAVCRRLARDHDELGLTTANLMMLATHTHSGPGGFTHYPFYNVTIPGFSAHVLEQLAGGIVRALVDANESRQPGIMRWAEGAIDPALEVAFNRSLGAYNRNPDVEHANPGDAPIALDRTMRMVRFEDKDGTPVASINFFAVHCTSVHSDNTSIHFDNKGYAAKFVEEDMAGRGHSGYVAAFAQGATGDVTPNFRYFKEKPWMRGKFLDDDDSARFNGRIQADQALLLLEEEAETMPARIASAHAFADFSDVDVAPEYVGGRHGLKTAPAEIGMAMFFGTEEGPGLPRMLRGVQKWLAAARPLLQRVGGGQHRQAYAHLQAEKIPWVETGARRFLGLRRLRWLPIPWRVHPALRMVRAMVQDDQDAKPWTPNVLPAQVFVLGSAAISAVPGEFTTVSGRRARATVGERLAAHGVTHTVLAGYANAYAGYVATPEEYVLQDYEGASTHFGKWTLPAWQTWLARLADGLADQQTGTIDLGDAAPPVFSEHELSARAFSA
ncbi:MAG: neutral/alkaline non-lysosomal ceramidase N-terminal domain-containing protein [Nannocystaceae bacterium]|nr:neutral/alkaline non-lysosomal ceramidase N-terminal domain-containing protein [Nannocystaceae bacterium]